MAGLTVCLAVPAAPRKKRAPQVAAIPWLEAKRLDVNAQELGFGVAQLMQRAGTALAKEVEKAMGARGTALFFCGKGHNGGDGLVAAQALQSKGKTAWVLLAEKQQRSATARAALEALQPGSFAIWSGRVPTSWSKADVVVDCLLGVGLKGELESPYKELAAHINRRRNVSKVISCDVPSGLAHAGAVEPHITVTFHAAKAGMNVQNSGKIIVAPIGIPRAAHDVGLGDLATYYPIPRPDSHKGDNGNLLVVAGSTGYTGAPYYAGMAAYRSGCDLVHATLANDPAAILACYGPEIMVHGVEPGPHLTPFGTAAILTSLERATALVIGPGLGNAPSTRQAVCEILQAAAALELPTVVDADGLDALTPELLARHGQRMVLTPHSREFLDLTGQAASEPAALSFAAKSGVTVLWKRQGAFITDGDRKRACHRGHPTMTVGGTGDVLAGSVGALLARGMAPFEAACAGAYLVGCAGEVAASLRSWGATAVDVADAIPVVLQRLG